NDIAPQQEQKQSFYASIPVVMAVTGNYHEIGVFLDSISKLARIVNVTNIKMTQPKMSGDKLVVSASYVATTFRFLPEAQAQAQPLPERIREPREHPRSRRGTQADPAAALVARSAQAVLDRDRHFFADGDAGGPGQPRLAGAAGRFRGKELGQGDLDPARSDR